MTGREKCFTKKLNSLAERKAILGKRFHHVNEDQSSSQGFSPPRRGANVIFKLVT